MRLRVGPSRKMPARTDLAPRRQSLGVWVGLHPVRHTIPLVELIGIHNEFLVTGHQPAMEPTAGLEHEAPPAQKASVERIGAFASGLCVGHLGPAERPARVKRRPQTLRQLPRALKHLRGFRRAESRRAGAHQLAIRDAVHGLGKDLR